MNERFTYFKSKIGFGKQGIDDNLKGYTFDFTVDNVLDCMNDLADENEQLKSENQSWLKTASHFDTVAHKDRDYAKRMHKENEQLKKENKKLTCIIKQLEAKYEDKGFSLAYDMGECE